MVDEVRAIALTVQGMPGVWVRDPLRDARQILVGTTELQRPTEVSELCLRGTADTLLRLPGTPVAVNSIIENGWDRPPSCPNQTVLRGLKGWRERPGPGGS